MVTWTAIEAASALVGSCLPTLRPLFAKNGPGNLAGSLRTRIPFRQIDMSRRTLENSDGQSLRPFASTTASSANKPAAENKAFHETNEVTAAPANQILMESRFSQWTESIGEV